MKRFILCLFAILLATGFTMVTSGCDGEHDEWMELVKSIDETPMFEASVDVLEAVPKPQGDELLLSDLRLNSTADRSHIESEVFAYWQSTIVDNISFSFVTPSSVPQQEFG